MTMRLRTVSARRWFWRSRRSDWPGSSPPCFQTWWRPPAGACRTSPAAASGLQQRERGYWTDQSSGSVGSLQVQNFLQEKIVLELWVFIPAPGNLPAFNSTIWSSCWNCINPGTILANSMICWITFVNLWAEQIHKSSQGWKEQSHIPSHCLEYCILTIFLNCSTLKSLIPWEQPTWICSRDSRQVLWWASKMESARSWPIFSGSENTRLISDHFPCLSSPFWTLCR